MGCYGSPGRNNVDGEVVGLDDGSSEGAVDGEVVRLDDGS